MMSELRRVENVVKQTLTFYRTAKEPVAIRVSELVDSVLTLMNRKLAAKNIDVKRKFGADDQIEGFAGELRQVAANLVFNAIDAVPQGGKIEIEITSGIDNVMMSVADNGSGIPEEIRPKLFDPFFSTKAEKGTGLGLWVAQGIVNRHSGRIDVVSTTDPERHGTRFTVILPRTFAGAGQRANFQLAA